MKWNWTLVVLGFVMSLSGIILLNQLNAFSQTDVIPPIYPYLIIGLGAFILVTTLLIIIFNKIGVVEKMSQLRFHRLLLWLIGIISLFIIGGITYIGTS
jgi:heme/copper-type cytochrome/quinol oxidase subunit 1